MNREIKFRGKDVNGHWQYGYVRDTFQNTTICPAKKFTSDGFTDTQEIMVVPNTVGQYTGLKDCNDKEIYECDILGGIVGGYVVWIDKEARFGIDVCGETGECNFDDFMQCDLEVIGNIWDNHELLEARDDV